MNGFDSRSWAWMAILAAALAAPAAAHAQEAATRAGYGAWGLDLDATDVSVRPGDGFFDHANGQWLQRTPIRGDRDRATLRQLMDEHTEAQLETLLEDAARQASEPARSTRDKVGLAYRAFMDERRIDALGHRPLEGRLREIARITRRDQVGVLMGRAAGDFGRPLFALSIGPDPKSPTRATVFIDQAGLGLPDRDYYLEPGFDAERAAYRDYVEKMLALAGWPAAKRHSDAIVQLETRIAQASWTRAQNRDVQASYSPMTVGELQALAPGFAWRAFLKAARVDAGGRVVVEQKGAFPALAALFAATPLDVLRAWLAFGVVDAAAPFLSSVFVDARFEFRGKVLQGLAQPEDRRKRAVRAVAGEFGNDAGQFGNLGWAVGQLYAARSFSPDTKKQVEALVGEVMAAFRRRLERNDWMSPATRAEALRKLDAYVIKVGYPASPRDYSALVVHAGDLVGNVRRAAAADWNFELAHLGRQIDRSEWLLTPQTDNAYNTGSTLSIEFPAALLQPPMFDPQADAAINYGAIGAYIGHEISHAFDDQGRKLDHEGRLRNWWTPEDAARFEERAARLGGQYAAYEPLPGLFINAPLTMGENIADLGGVNVALDAWRASLHGQPAPVLAGLSGEQRFFLGWAQAWRGKLTEAATRALVKSDPHAPRRFRVDGVVRNIDDWVRAFGVAPGDRLYLEPALRVRIW